jgi:predicted nucleic acid-binding protein
VAALYFDSSAFVKLLIEEPDSDLAARLWDEADLVASSRLAYPEVAAALSAARRGGRISAAGERTARREWQGTFWPSARVVELTSEIATNAAELSQSFVLGGADAIHVASALALSEVAPILVAWDARLRDAALEAGLVVAPA